MIIASFEGQVVGKTIHANRKMYGKVIAHFKLHRTTTSTASSIARSRTVHFEKRIGHIGEGNFGTVNLGWGWVREM